MNIGSIFVILQVTIKERLIYMIKFESMKKQKLIRNPYIYYVTNWGFVNSNPENKNPRSVNKKS